MSYKLNFITNIIIKVDFSKPIEVTDKLIGELKTIFQDDFPDVQNAEVVSLEVTLTGKEKTTREVRNKAISLLNKANKSNINLEPNSLAIELTKFNEYEDLKRPVVKMNLFLNGSIAPIGISRLGLRFINQIKVGEGHPLDWNRFIDDRLIQSVKIIGASNEISRAMGMIELNKTEYNLRFNYGWFNSEYPNPIAKKEFVLDYDCYSTNEIESRDLIEKISLYYKAIKNLFDESVESKLIEIMERGDDGVR